jgi:pSer/pThr/pTyr-binding forkhead associated (FHA) protein/uncharacterized RDD family membrane protein YckC
MEMERVMAIVGRDRICDICLPSPQVSGRHALVEYLGPDMVRIRDLNSSNGTFVNGKRVTEASVRLGDVVAFGSHVFDLGAAIPQLAREHAQERSGMTVGRDTTCDAVVPDNRVSGLHALLIPEGDGVWVVDKGSQNGTTVNGAPVSRAKVRRGDRVALGSCPVDVFRLVEPRRAPAMHGATPPPLSAPTAYEGAGRVYDTPGWQDSGRGTTRLEYAGFWLRLAAYLIDSAIVGAAIWLLSLVLLDWALSTMNTSIYLLTSLTILVVGLLYYPLMECSEKQGTLGKILLGIQVVDLEGRRISFGRALGRYFGKIISGAILYIGYIMAGFTEKKQGLHDMMAGTLVVRRQ